MEIKSKDIINEKIEIVINQIFDKQNFQNFLNFSSIFFNYSYKNQCLIYFQRPDATLIAGKRAWNNNYHAELIENYKPIFILCPTLSKDKEKLEYNLQPAFDCKDTDYKYEPEYYKSEIIEVLIPSLKAITGYDFIPVLRQEENKASFNKAAGEFYYNEELDEELVAVYCITSYIKSLIEDNIQANFVSYVVLKHFHLNTDHISFIFVSALADKSYEEKEAYIKQLQENSFVFISLLKEQIDRRLKYKKQKMQLRKV